MSAITRNEGAALDVPMVSFSLNGIDVTARATETILTVAKREGRSGSANSDSGLSETSGH